VKGCKLLSHSFTEEKCDIFEEAGNFSPTGLWHLSFNALRDLPEKLVEGKEEVFLNWFYDHGLYNQSAITAADREEYIKQYSKPGAMRAGPKGSDSGG
jgi:hypothetical protein